MNIESARGASEFTNILKTDSRGRLIAALVPGHNGKMYEVTLHRTVKEGTQTIGTKCVCQNDGSDCKGNANQICYHSLAAILAGAKKTKVKVAFCKTREDADKLSNIGGDSYLLESVQSQKTAWMSVKDLLTTTMIC
jgi:hypothetical protein